MISGDVAPGFEAVRDVFEEQRDVSDDGGAAFAATLEGRFVVDLWTGRAGDSPWRRETRAVLMSATKGLTTIAVARLVDRGVLDVEAPVAKYWPEFAGGGKGDVTVAHVLSHASGVISVPGYEEILGPDGSGYENVEEVLRRLESAEPEWRPPGSAHSYHGRTIGWMAGEIVRRISGVTVGTLIRNEIAEPLGLEVDLGTPPEKQALVAPVIDRDSRHEMEAFLARLADPALFRRMSHMVRTPDRLDLFFSRPDNLAMEMPWSNATGTARALATVYGALANGGTHRGVQILTPATIEAFTTERQHGTDRATGAEIRWGLGFELPVRRDPRDLPALPGVWGPHDEAFGHPGTGGQIGIADPVSRVGLGFVRSHLASTSPLGGHLVDAVYDCLSN